MATLSVIIPTAGRASLRRTLESLTDQLKAGDEVIVVGDIHDGPIVTTPQIVADAGPAVRYVTHDAGHHCWGHCQLNYGMMQARGNYLVFNDDDDIATPGALAAIRTAIAAREISGPLLFQFVTPWRQILWATPMMTLGAIGGHCLVTPNNPARTGVFGCDYMGDFTMIQDTVSKWGGEVAWIPQVIAQCRP